MILPVVRVQAPVDLAIPMKLLVGHDSPIKQVLELSIRFQNLVFVSVVEAVLDGSMVFILLLSMQRRSVPCVTLVLLVYHAHALPRNQFVSPIVANIMYSTCRWHLNAR